MRKLFLTLNLVFFAFSTTFSYARTLSKGEYRYLLGSYLLGRGNKKRLIKLLNKTDVINAKLMELENKQKAFEEDIKTLKLQINELSNKLDQIIKLLKNPPQKNANIEPKDNQKTSQKSEENLQEVLQELSKEINKKKLDKSKKETTTVSTSKENETASSIALKTEKEKTKEEKIKKEKTIEKEKTKEDTSSSKHSSEKNEDENIKKNRERQYSTSNLINDIENAIYYKGKGNLKAYEKLIEKMMKKYPKYRSKLERCLKEPDYIFQLYIEILNLESK